MWTTWAAAASCLAALNDGNGMHPLLTHDARCSNTFLDPCENPVKRSIQMPTCHIRHSSPEPQ